MVSHRNDNIKTNQIIVDKKKEIRLITILFFLLLQQVEINHPLKLDYIVYGQQISFQFSHPHLH